MTEQHTYKVAKNRGNDRVWLEGARLADIGIARGMEYVKSFIVNDAGRMLILDFSGKLQGRKTKVAGTADRPIIDITSRQVSEFMDGATYYTATFHADDGNGFPFVTITPA